jgi:hypothetical protein
MTPTILFRVSDFDSEEECKIAEKYFHISRTRSACPRDSLVIGRYSVLPYYYELVQDLQYNNSKLINSHDQHLWIANFEYYEALKEYTPETWDDNNFYRSTYEGPFVVKGKTNSKKHKWNKLMYAKDRFDATKIASELMSDMMIVEQGVIYRKYVPLKTFEIGLNNLPFTNEWRFFYLGSERLAYGYYWSSAEKTDYQITQEGLDFADKIAKIARKYVNFFVLDIAETEEGNWILIEINEAMMSGLSEVDPDELYGNLLNRLRGAIMDLGQQ